MGRKDKKKTKKTTKVLSLQEFTGGETTELVALPSAPKAPEQWEDEGGKPEYNSKGYKERQLGMRAGPRSRDDESKYDDDHDWTRRGPLDGGESSLFSSNLDTPRDWGDMRRGSEAGADDDQAPQPDRNWNDMRRGPIESTFQGEGGGAPNRDWTQRKGPIDTAFPEGRPQADWNGARGGRVVESQFSADGADRERDWTQRKGPVDASNAVAELTASFAQHAAVDDDDWAAARKGPIESEFANNEQQSGAEERDWSERKPVEANTPRDDDNADDPEDWTERRGPVEAIHEQQQPKEKDWAGIRSGDGVGPIEQEAAASTDRDATSADHDAAPDTNSSWTRRGPVRSKAEEQQELQAASNAGSPDFRARRKPLGDDGDGADDRAHWRRDGNGIAARGARRGRGGRPNSMAHGHHYQAQAQTQEAEQPAEPERDWSAARRSMPEGRAAVPVVQEPAEQVEQTEQQQVDSADVVTADENAGVKREEPSVNEKSTAEEDISAATTTAPTSATTYVEDDEWTTVRSNPKKEARLARRGGREIGRGWRSADRNPTGEAATDGTSNNEYPYQPSNRRFNRSVARGGARPQSFGSDRASGMRGRGGRLDGDSGNSSNSRESVPSANGERHNSAVTPVL